MNRRSFFRSLGLTIAAFNLPVSLVESAKQRNPVSNVKEAMFRWREWTIHEDIEEVMDINGMPVAIVQLPPVLKGTIFGPEPRPGDMTIPTDLIKSKYVITEVSEFESIRIGRNWKVVAHPLL